MPILQPAVIEYKPLRKSSTRHRDLLVNVPRCRYDAELTTACGRNINMELRDYMR